MKIQSLRYFPYSLPFARPFTTAREVLTHREGWLVEVRDGEGGWGLGEAAPLAGFGMETPAETARVLEAWATSLPGREVGLEGPFDVETPPAFGLAADFPAAPAARHGLELALLDLAARRAGLPLARWLHRGAAGAVEVNATVGADEPAESARQAAALAGQGFKTVKAKVEPLPGPEAARRVISRVTALRRALGPEVRLRLDANESWVEETAAPLIDALAPLKIEYLEQPLPADDLNGMARLAARSPIPIAADEAVLSPAQAQKIVAMGAARVLVLKPMALGGVIATLAVARLAARHGLPAVVTTTLEGAYARLGAAHAAAALCGLLPREMASCAHGLATGSLLAEDLLPDPPQPRGGSITLPDAPGLGLARPASLPPL
ncbi:MAG: o-succinylbenzoate synthase [bacterium]